MNSRDSEALGSPRTCLRILAFLNGTSQGSIANSTQQLCTEYTALMRALHCDSSSHHGHRKELYEKPMMTATLSPKGDENGDSSENFKENHFDLEKWRWKEWKSQGDRYLALRRWWRSLGRLHAVALPLLEP